MSIYRGRTRKEFYLASTLYDSIEDRNLSSVKSLLTEKGADPNLVLPQKGISPFHLAIGCDSNDFALTITALILQHEGNPNIRSDDGLTPVHIAAAWGRLEILQLLLSCGGDPEVRDVNRRTPLHYAVEEGHESCVDLLKSFVSDRNALIHKEEENVPGVNLVLDKIVLNNGQEEGDYEILEEPKDSIISYNLPVLLPKPDTNEYVMNWFDKQDFDPSIVYPKIPQESESEDSDSLQSCESSVYESDVENKNKFPENGFITFRKVYRKTRKISKESRDSKGSEKKALCDTTNTCSNYEDALSALKEFSRESGILTLPVSLSNSHLDPEESVKCPEPKQSFNRSDDFFTCSTVSSNPLEKNVFEITEDEGITIELKSNKSEAETELSFISVSEVYKYVDESEGVVLFERRFLKPTSDCGSLKSSSFSSKLSSLPETVDYDTDTLRKELNGHGFQPGPITFSTKRIYLKKLKQLKKKPVILPVLNRKVYSIELEKTLRESSWLNDVSSYKALEEAVSKQFGNPDPSRKWREGVSKSSFTYLLLDPRISNNLPCRAELLQPKEIWETFLASIFYVGKGKRARPYQHLYEAVNLWNTCTFTSKSRKLQQIMDIWKSDSGVICLHVFQNVIPVEAYTREAAMLSALKIENLTNVKSGEFYGVAATWAQRQKRMLGVYLLYKAMLIFLQEGERQLCPSDIN